MYIYSFIFLIVGLCILSELKCKECIQEDSIKESKRTILFSNFLNRSTILYADNCTCTGPFIRDFFETPEPLSIYIFSQELQNEWAYLKNSEF